MKVKDLLEKLQKCDPEADVVLYCGTSEDADIWRGDVSEYANPQEASGNYYCKGATISEILQVQTDEVLKVWVGRDGVSHNQYKYVDSENRVVVLDRKSVV